MYYVTKRIEISAAHKLSLDYESKCTSLHGHNWIVTVEDGALAGVVEAEAVGRGYFDSFADVVHYLTSENSVRGS